MVFRFDEKKDEFKNMVKDWEKEDPSAFPPLVLRFNEYKDKYKKLVADLMDWTN